LACSRAIGFERLARGIARTRRGIPRRPNDAVGYSEDDCLRRSGTITTAWRAAMFARARASRPSSGVAAGNYRARSEVLAVTAPEKHGPARTRRARRSGPKGHVPAVASPCTRARVMRPASREAGRIRLARRAAAAYSGVMIA
jgi:hypothetical protein